MYSKKKGFTLIELLVVMAIIAIMAAFLFPTMSRARMRARSSKVKGDLLSIRTALELYFQEYDTFPTNDLSITGLDVPDTGLVKLVMDTKGFLLTWSGTPDKNKAQELLKNKASDPFNPSALYRYFSNDDSNTGIRNNATAWVLFSTGPYGEPGDKPQNYSAAMSAPNLFDNLTASTANNSIIRLSGP